VKRSDYLFGGAIMLPSPSFQAPLARDVTAAGCAGKAVLVDGSGNGSGCPPAICGGNTGGL
jgi:hypothetical protein